MPTQDGLREACDGVERLLADPEYVRLVQWRVARVVKQAVNSILHGSARRNDTGDYAARLGEGLGDIWRALSGEVKQDQLWQRARNCAYPNPWESIAIPLGVLYLNSLGVRWKILERHPERDYDLRVAVYMGEYFQDPRNRTAEDEYNEQIFSRRSSHLLRLLCQCDASPRLVLRIREEDPFVPVRSSCSFPYHIVGLPPWQGTGLAARRAFRQLKPHTVLQNDELLETAFEWMDSKDRSSVHSNLARLRILPRNAPYLLKSIFNFYRLYWRTAGLQAGRLRHLVYLPDPTLPKASPSGFAGMVCVKDDEPDPDDYGRLLFRLQEFFSRCFSQVVEAVEAETVQVAVEKGLRTTDTWRGMFVSGKADASKPVSFLAHFSKKPSAKGRSVFDKQYSLVHRIVGDCFAQKASPEEETFRKKERPGLKQIDDSDSIHKILASQAFGYHALCREAYRTIQELWWRLGIFTASDALGTARPDAGPPEGSMLELIHTLLFFEPALHYMQSYREHFLHSFNVLLMGYWLLSTRKEEDGEFIVLPNLTGRKRAEILRLWTVVAPLHDMAYPLERLAAGASDLFRRYTRRGVETLEHVQVLPQWWNSLTKPHYYRFFHERVAETTAEARAPDGGVTQGRPLFIGTAPADQQRPVPSSQLAAELLKLLVTQGNHGVLGALVLHNHFPHASTLAPRKTALYRLSESDQREICVAIAFHHICDIYKMDRTSGTLATHSTREGDWQHVDRQLDSSAHPLAYLLILCDTLCQWGRCRRIDPGARGYSESPALTADERWRDASLYDVEVRGSEIRIHLHYPRAVSTAAKPKGNFGAVTDFTRHFRWPIGLLAGHPGVRVVLHGNLKAREGAPIDTDTRTYVALKQQ